MATIFEAASFALSGATAKALASLLTNSVATTIESPPAKTSSSQLDPPFASQDSPAPPPLPARPPPPQKTRLALSDFVQHIDSAVFFLVLTVASTRFAKLHDQHCSTAREAAEAFVAGGTAGVCVRLVSDVAFPRDRDGSRHRAAGGWQQRLASRLTWHNLEEDLVLALDPALTSCLYKILDKMAVKKVMAAKGKHKSLDEHAEMAATTFVVAAVSKVIAATVTYPLTTAKKRRDQQAAEDKANAEAKANGAAHGRDSLGRNRANHRLLSVLWRFGMVEGVLALFAGWLPAVALASLGHGITKAGQEVLGKLIKKLMTVMAGAWGASSVWHLLGLRPHSSRPPPSSSSSASSTRAAPDLYQRQQQQQQLRQRLVAVQEWLPTELRAPATRPSDRPLPWPRENSVRAVAAARSQLADYQLPGNLARPPYTEWARPSQRALPPHVWPGPYR